MAVQARDPPAQEQQPPLLTHRPITRCNKQIQTAKACNSFIMTLVLVIEDGMRTSDPLLASASAPRSVLTRAACH